MLIPPSFAVATAPQTTPRFRQEREIGPLARSLQALPPNAITTTEETLFEASALEFGRIDHIHVTQTSGEEHTLYLYVLTGTTGATADLIAAPVILSNGTAVLSALHGYAIPAGYKLRAKTSAGTCNVCMSVERVFSGQ